MNVLFFLVYVAIPTCAFAAGTYIWLLWREPEEKK
jgi:hypothetical protein